MNFYEVFEMKKEKKTISLGENLIENYKLFLNKGKTERECVSQIIIAAEKNGYKDISKCSKNEQINCTISDWNRRY